MIELKNITKSYKSKKGKDTLALNNISLKLNNKGMVFILGKSGSGKSTLLNILGGLDKYDSGDMLILGKSSKDFTQADFDSYRNTYIGFIFQEFNILEDYNVYENIVLALQLQQKEINNSEIDNLLEKLEIKDLKERKVNELSGGQKQRTAIARALIKNPKIILADEPTGNLDSKTGKDVMNLLKEISKEKLVVIVSHDNEFAKFYADRIIEIKDGNIINDTNVLDIEENTENYKTIKSHLPIKESFRLGVGSLKHKKLKLFFTIFLTMCTLLFLSITDTMSSYNVEKAHSKLLKDRNEEFVQIEKYIFYNENDYSYGNKDELTLTKNDIEKINNKLGKESYPVYKLQNSFVKESTLDLLKIKRSEDKYTINYNAAEVVETDNLSKIIKEKIIGREAKELDEIVISSYFADLILENGIKIYSEDDNQIKDIYKPKSFEELVTFNQYFYFGDNNKVKIVGVINYDISKYQELKKIDTYSKVTDEIDNLSNELYRLVENVYGKIYVKKGFINNLKVDNKIVLSQGNIYRLELEKNKLNTSGLYIGPEILDDKITYWDQKEWKTVDNLQKDEVILNIRGLKDFDSKDYENKLKKYLENNEGDEEELKRTFFEKYVEDYNIIGDNLTIKIYTGKTFDEDKPTEKIENLKVVGIIGLDENENNHYFSKETLSKYKNEYIQNTALLVPINTKEEAETILKNFPYNAELSAKTTYSSEVLSLINSVNLIKDIGFYISIVFVVFAIFLIGNFVFTSINYRKKEIGVLRALGATSIDICKIFFWEGLTLSLISATLASILLIIITNLLNSIIMTNISLILTPFIIGIRQFIIIYLLVFIVVLTSLILPIRKISKMKPIDAILKK